MVERKHGPERIDLFPNNEGTVRKIPLISHAEAGTNTEAKIPLKGVKFIVRNFANFLQMTKMKKGLNSLKPFTVAVIPSGFKPETF